MKILIVASAAAIVGGFAMSGAQTIIPGARHWLIIIPVLVVSAFAGRGAAS